MRNLCPQVTVSSTPKQTSRFEILVGKDFQAILGEEEDGRNRGRGQGGIVPFPPRTPKKRIFQVLFRKERTPLKNLVWRTTDRAQLDWQRNSISVEIVLLLLLLSIERS
jgi:hypothetical protein